MLHQGADRIPAVLDESSESSEAYVPAEVRVDMEEVVAPQPRPQHGLPRVAERAAYEGLAGASSSSGDSDPILSPRMNGGWAGLRKGGGDRLWDPAEQTFRQLPIPSRTLASEGTRLSLITEQPLREDVFGQCSSKARMWAFQFVFDLKLRTFGTSTMLKQEKRKHPNEQMFRKVLDPKRTVKSKKEGASFKWFFYCLGIMPEFSSWFRSKLFPLCFLLDAMLRGSAQVMICNNPFSGLIALAALAVSSPWLCICSIMGLVAATLFAFLMGVNRAAFRGGLFGYNGMLVGGAMAVLLNGGDWNPLALAFIIPGACISVIITVGMGTAFGGAFGTPPFTLPFIFTTMIWAGCMHHTTYFRPVAALTPSFGGTMPVIGNTTAGSVFSAWMSGCGQIYIAGSPYSGFMMVVAMAIFSRVNALGMLIGSAIGIACAYAFGAPTEEINAGLWGYNPALLMIAMFTFYIPSFKAVVIGIIGSIMTCFLVGFLNTILSPLGLPPLTLAFSATAFMLLLIQNAIVGLYVVPLDRITYPEEHLRKVRLIRKVTKHLKKASFKEWAE